jgi:hypothetical protein
MACLTRVLAARAMRAGHARYATLAAAAKSRVASQSFVRRGGG